MGENFGNKIDKLYSGVRCAPVDFRRSEHAQQALYKIKREIYGTETYLGKEDGQ